MTGTDRLDSEVDDAYPNDDFDNWCSDRDRREDNVPRYVSPDMTGYEDLDAYGGWRDVPEYGAMWVPTGVVADWALLPLRPLGLDFAVGLDLGGRLAPGDSRLSITVAG